MTKKFTKGFTLIELLVVIAIIGVLSSVVLASLNTARNKGANTATKANLANARAQAEIYYDTNSGYGTAATSNVTNGGTWSSSPPPLCTVAGTGGVGGIAGNVAAAAASAGQTAYCNVVAGTSPAWAAFVQLKAAESTIVAWCVDSTGASRGLTANPTTTVTACPAS